MSKVKIPESSGWYKKYLNKIESAKTLDDLINISKDLRNDEKLINHLKQRIQERRVFL